MSIVISQIQNLPLGSPLRSAFALCKLLTIQYISNLSICISFGESAILRSNKSASFQPVTSLETFVPWVELEKSITVASETIIGQGAAHESNEI